MAKWRWIAVGLTIGLVAAGITGLQVAPSSASAQGASRIFELRTYTANPGKFEAMKSRFRDHIIPLFKKHNLEVVGFWTYADPPASENTLVYVIAHQSREAAKKNWSAFSADPAPEAGVGRHGEGRTDQHEGRVGLFESHGLLADQVGGWSLQRSPRPRPGVVASIDHQNAIDNGVVHARRIRLRLLERVRLCHGRRIEDDDVGREALVQLTAIPQAENLRGQTSSSCGRRPPASEPSRRGHSGRAPARWWSSCGDAGLPLPSRFSAEPSLAMATQGSFITVRTSCFRHRVEHAGDRAALFSHEREAGVSGIGITAQLGDLRQAHALVFAVLRLPRPSEDDAVPRTVLVDPGLKILVLLDFLAASPDP